MLVNTVPLIPDEHRCYDVAKKDDYWLPLYKECTTEIFSWFTVSPRHNPKLEYSYKSIMREWLTEFTMCSALCEALIIWAETTSKAQLHFHCLFRFRTKHDYYTYKRKFVAKWFHMGIICELYRQPPKEGFDYIWKQHEEMHFILSTSPIWDLEGLQDARHTSEYQFMKNLSIDSD